MSKNLIDNREIAIEIISRMLAKYYVDAREMNLEFVVNQMKIKLLE